MDEKRNCPSCGSLNIVGQWKKDEFEYSENSIKIIV